MRWNRITKDSPCPVCGREKFCMVNDNRSAVLCTKVPSDKPVGEAGYLHVLDPERNEGWQPSELEQVFTGYRSNVLDGMPQLLAEDLGVTAESIEALGVGYFPSEQAWVWAEMDADGTVIGLLKRFVNGKKVMVKGSGRGLMYTRPLPRDDRPVVVIEGATDTLAAMDMGYLAVGRPSADGGLSFLRSLLNGRDVIVVGENDEAGRKGMLKTVSALRDSCSSVRSVLPPSRYKDLRQWHPSAEEFELHLSQASDNAGATRSVSEVNPFELAQRWLDEVYTKRGHRLMHYFRGNWYYYNGSSYSCIESSREKEVELDTQLYPYFNSFHVVDKKGDNIKVRRLTPNRHLIEDIKHALRATCVLRVGEEVTEPFYIGSRQHIDAERTVVFRNGMLDVETMELKPLSSDVFVTSTLPFDYDPRAKCDLWNGSVHEFFSNDQECIDLLSEWFGYNTIASNFMQQMMMLYGVPNSGKSTVLRVLQSLLGPERVCAFDISAFNDKFGTSELVDKYAALISEDLSPNSTEALRVMQMIKKITGEDTVTVQKKYRDAYSVRLFCRFTYAGNKLPIWSDDSLAIMRRFNMLYFPNDFTKVDKPLDRQLSLKLKQELPGIANWALAGLRRLLDNGDFTRPRASIDPLGDFEGMSSPLRTMVDEYCVLGDDKFETVQLLYELHRQVYSDWGLKAMGLPLFRTQLRSAVPSLANGKKAIGGVMERVYQGIQIKSEAKQRYLGRS